MFSSQTNAVPHAGVESPWDCVAAPLYARARIPSMRAPGSTWDVCASKEQLSGAMAVPNVSAIRTLRGRQSSRNCSLVMFIRLGRLVNSTLARYLVNSLPTEQILKGE